MADVTIRRDEDLLCGRLVALPSTQTAEQLEEIRNMTRGFERAISIDFPAMPDTIELMRSADYYVNYNPIMPDGLHQYMGTKPMEIPVSFKIHSFDQDYCKEGALTLLQLAARLHAFVLPISTFKGRYAIAPVGSSVTPNSGQSNESALKSSAQTVEEYGVLNANKQPNAAISPPVTCWLHLMWTSNTEPGISAIGYVREVKVVFNGPWLRGPVGSGAFNLPTSADFSFVFVHRPGHGNNMKALTSKAQYPPSAAEAGHAFADDVKDNFYNTRKLVWQANYQGFATDPASSLGTNPPTTTDVQEQQKTQPPPPSNEETPKTEPARIVDPSRWIYPWET